MSITERQRNILNPYPEEFSDLNAPHDGELPQGGANGIDYNYSDRRNVWVIEGIHDCYISYGYFPIIGKYLRQLGPVNSDNNILTIADAMAYCALYPQNAIVERHNMFNTGDENTHNQSSATQSSLGLMPLTSDEGERALDNIIDNLIDNGKMKEFTSLSSPELLKKENQALYDVLSSGRYEALNGETRELYRDMFFSSLITVPPKANDNRLAQIRRIFGNNPDDPVLKPRSEVRTQADLYLSKQDSNLDLAEWTNNISPLKPRKTLYYNPVSRELFYCIRTSNRDPRAYDSGYYATDETQQKNVENFKREALREMIKFSERYYESEEDLDQYLHLVEFFSRYGDSFRPSPPEGYGVWLLCARANAAIPARFQQDLQDGPIVILEETATPLELSRFMLDRPSYSHNISYPVSVLREYVDKTIETLRYYEDKLFEEGVSQEFLVKINLAQEIIRLEQFMPTVYELYSTVGEILEEEDRIEIRLSDTYEVISYGVNGRFYFENIGIDLNTLLGHKPIRAIQNPQDTSTRPSVIAKNRSEEESYRNSFSNLSPTTFNYILNSKLISQEFLKIEGGEPAPLTQFFISYTFPNPNDNSVNPTSWQAQSSQNNYRAFNNFESTNELANSVPPKVLFTPKQKKATLAGTGGPIKDTKVFKSSKEASRVLAKKSRTQQELYMLVRSSVGSCDTGLAQTIKTGLQAYELYTRKARPKDWVTLAVNTVRNQIIDLLVETNRLGPDDASEIRGGIDSGMQYARDPAKVRRQVEKYVNDQLDGCLSVIGNVIAETVIDPAGKPKKPKQYWQNTLKPPKKLQITKSPTRDFLSPWRKKLKEIIIKYIEQLIMSVLKDIISAALGCGPSPKNDTPTKQKFGANQSFGMVRINEIVDKEKIDLLGVASALSMVNTYVSLDDLGNKQSVVEPPTLEQLRQFNDDVSDYLTKEEAIALLDASLGRDSLASIREMINDGYYDDVGLGTINESLKSDPKYLLQFQDSLKLGDTKYATLGLNEDLIKNYFQIIGQQVLDTEDLLDNLDPKEAFCLKYNIEDTIGLLDIGISKAQLNTQIDNEVSAKIDKIKMQCEFLGDLHSLQMSLDSFWSSLPGSAAYDSWLAAISGMSKAIQAAILDALRAEQQSTRIPDAGERDYTTTDFYKFCENKFGGRNTKPIVVQRVPGVPLWTIGDEDQGSISFTLYGNQVTFFYEEEDSERAILTTIPLSVRNLTPETGAGAATPTYSLRGLADDTGVAALGVPLDNYKITSQTCEGLNNMLTQINQSLFTTDILRETDRQANFIKLVDNSSGLEGEIVEQMADFWVTDLGLRRLSSVIKILSSPAFEAEGDNCSPSKEKNIAVAAYNGIQIRVINFLLNIGPLFRVYGGYLTPDILRPISYYLSQQIMKDLIDRQILNIYLESIDQVDQAYSVADGAANPEGVSLRLYEKSGQREKLANLVQAILETYLVRFGAGNTYTFIGTNLFQSETLSRSYKNLVNTVRTGTWNFGGGAGQPPKSYQIENAESLSSLLPGNQISATQPVDWTESAALYYLPVPLLIAMQIIYYDKIIDVNNKWPQFRFSTGQKEARADDALLSAINDTNITVFSNPYSGYPIEIAGTRYYSQEEIEEKILFLQSQRTRIYSLERIFGPLSLADEDYISRAYRTGGDDPSYLKKSGMTNTAIEEFRDFFNPIYSATNKTYRDMYSTTEEREDLQRNALGASLATSFPNNFSADFGRNTTQWMRQRAWYERGRLLGQAGSYDKSLLYEYMEGQDLGSTDWLLRLINDQGEERAEAARKTIKTARELTVDNNTWANTVAGSALNDNPDIANFWNYIYQGARYLRRQHGILGGVASGLVLGLGLITRTIFSVTVIPGLLLWITDWAWNGVDNLDKYLDPDEPDSLKYFRNPPDRMVDGEMITIDMQRGLIKAGNILDNHKSKRGGPSTMDKIAISVLYYELAWKSNDYKPLFDPESPNNEIEQLADYIEYQDDEALEAGFPVYLESSFFRKTGRGSVSMRPYFSVEDLDNALFDLKLNPIYAKAQDYKSNDQAITRLLNEILEQISRAEAADPDDNYYVNLRAEIYGTNAQVGPIGDGLVNYTLHQASAASDLLDIGFDGATSLWNFMSKTRYADVLGSPGATRDGYATYRADMLQEVNDTTGAIIRNPRQLEDPRPLRTINTAMEQIRTKTAQIVQLIDQQHLIYQEVNREIRAEQGALDYKVGRLYLGENPTRIAAVAVGIQESFLKNRFSMQDWINTINADVTELERAIRWRS